MVVVVQFCGVVLGAWDSEPRFVVKCRNTQSSMQMDVDLQSMVSRGKRNMKFLSYSPGPKTHCVGGRIQNTPPKGVLFSHHLGRVPHQGISIEMCDQCYLSLICSDL